MRNKILSLITIIALLSTMLPTVALGATRGAIASGGSISSIYVYTPSSSGTYTFTDSTKGTLKGHITQVAAEIGDRIVIKGDQTTIYWCSNGASKKSTPTVIPNETEGAINWYGYVENTSSKIWTIEGEVTSIRGDIYENRDLKYNFTVSHTMTYGSSNYNVTIGNVTIALDNPSKLAQFDIGEKIVDASAGRNHSLLLTENGEVYAMGMNTDGQLGLGDKKDRMSATKLEGISGIKAIETGWNHSVLLNENGEVYVMGRNSSGQLGLENIYNTTIPTKLEGLPAVKAISAGGSHTLLLTESGEVYGMGDNDNGELGLGDTEGRKVPTKIPGISGIKAISTDWCMSLLLTESGGVYGMGANGYYWLSSLSTNGDVTTPTKITNMTGIKAIDTGMGGDKKFLTESGAVYEMVYHGSKSQITGLSGIKEISQGDGHDLYLTESGDVYVSGDNAFGQLGIGNTTTQSTPIKLETVSGIKTIAAGQYYSLLVAESGEVYGMGYNKDGKLGFGEAHYKVTPTQIREVSNIKSVVAASYDLNNEVYESGYLLTEAGEVYSMGYNKYGRLGLGDTNIRKNPVKVTGITGIKEIAARGGNYALFLSESGQVYATGYNGSGQLGLGDTTTRTSPTKINGISDIKAIAVGDYHSLLLTESGEVYGMGSNGYGQLGSTTSAKVPTKIEGISNVKAMAAGRYHTLLLTESGEVYVAGYNDRGQLGLGDTTNRTSLTKLTGISKIKEIAAGALHSLLLTESGEVYGMGYGVALGYSTSTADYQLTPIKIEGINGVKEISAGGYASVFLTESGEVYSMGGNYYGELGLGDKTYRKIPTKIEGIDNVESISISTYHMLLSTESGNVYTVGSESFKHVYLLPEISKGKVLIDETLYLVPKFLDSSKQVNPSTFKYAFDKKGETAMQPFDVYKGIYLEPNFNGKYKLRIYAEANWGPDISKVYTIDVINAPNNPPEIELEKEKGEVLAMGYTSVTGSTMYFTDSGEIYASGGWYFGNNKAEKVLLPEGVKLQRVSIAGGCIFFWDENGDIYGLGSNGYGELGFGNFESVDTITRLEIPDDKKIIDVEYNAAIAWSYLSEDGDVYVTGWDFSNNLGTHENSVSNGGNNSYVNVLTKLDMPNNGKIKKIAVGDGVWGAWYIDNEGRVYETGSAAKPIEIDIPEDAVIIDMVTDGYSQWFLDEKGDVYVYGNNSDGELGTGNTTNVSKVQKINIPNNAKIKKIITCPLYGGGDSVWYLDQQGNVYVTGDNEYGQLGTGNTTSMLTATKIKIPGDVEIVDIATDTQSTLYLGEDGNVYASGLNNYGQLGAGDTNNLLSVTKISIPSEGKIKRIITDRYKNLRGNDLLNVFYLDDMGNVYACGYNSYGQLGLGHTNNVKNVTQINFPGGTKIVDVVSDLYSTWYVDTEGNVYSCGNNESGQLGLGDKTNRNIPTKIPGLKLFGDYPRVRNLMITDEALPEVKSSHYAFVSQTALDSNDGDVPDNLWIPFDIDVPAAFLAPTSNDTYYLYVKLGYAEAKVGENVYRDGEEHTAIIGPFMVTGIKGDADSVSYVTGDIHVMDGMNAEFNLVFIPSQDMTLGNIDETFNNIFTPEKLNIELLDGAGNVLTTNNKMVINVYKNGLKVTDVTPNYVFTKRDTGSDKNNTYVLRVMIGGDKINKAQSNVYQIRFNGLKGVSIDGTNQAVSLNSQPFTMMVYVTELADLT